MKIKTLIVIIFCLSVILASAKTNRPTTNYLIFYDDGQSKTVSALSLDEALATFRATTKHEIVHSVSRKSFVTSVWIDRK